MAESKKRLEILDGWNGITGVTRLELLCKALPDWEACKKLYGSYYALASKDWEELPSAVIAALEAL